MIADHVRRFVVSSIAVACSGASQQGLPDDSIRTPATLVALPSMIASRAAHTATTLRDGRVLIVGGLSAGGSAELFDPTTRRFSVTGSLRVPRASHTATLLPDGRVLIAGGFNGTWLSSTEIYDPGSGTFSLGPELTEPRSDHLAISLYDPERGVFRLTGSMTHRRHRDAAVLLGSSNVLAGNFSAAAQLSSGQVLIAGGYGNGTGPRKSAWLFVP